MKSIKHQASVKTTRSYFNKKSVLIGFLLLANLIGFVVARNYFHKNACMSCSIPTETKEEGGQQVHHGSTAMFSWAFTLLEMMRPGNQVR
jgi:hypothetical protein